jgi:hypothetical protein
LKDGPPIACQEENFQLALPSAFRLTFLPDLVGTQRFVATACDRRRSAQAEACGYIYFLP